MQGSSVSFKVNLSPVLK